MRESVHFSKKILWPLIDESPLRVIMFQMVRSLVALVPVDEVKQVLLSELGWKRHHTMEHRQFAHDESSLSYGMVERETSSKDTGDMSAFGVSSCSQLDICRSGVLRDLVVAIAVIDYAEQVSAG